MLTPYTILFFNKYVNFCRITNICLSLFNYCDHKNVSLFTRKTDYSLYATKFRIFF